MKRTCSLQLMIQILRERAINVCVYFCLLSARSFTDSITVTRVMHDVRDGTDFTSRESTGYTIAWTPGQVVISKGSTVSGQGVGDRRTTELHVVVRRPVLDTVIFPKTWAVGCCKSVTLQRYESFETSNVCQLFCWARDRGSLYSQSAAAAAAAERLTVLKARQRCVTRSRWRVSKPETKSNQLDWQVDISPSNNYRITVDLEPSEDYKTPFRR